MCTDFTFYRIFLHCLYPSNSPVIKKRRIFISLLYRYIHKLIISWQSQITMIAIGCCSDHNLALSGFCFCPSPQMSISSNRGLEWGCVQREAICSKRSSRALSSRRSRCLRWGLERSMCGRTTHMKMHTSGKGWSLLRPMWRNLKTHAKEQMQVLTLESWMRARPQWGLESLTSAWDEGTVDGCVLDSGLTWSSPWGRVEWSRARLKGSENS